MKDPGMKISVAIATYNRAVMVCEAIEAALAQSTPPDEIVVSNDASTDSTAALLSEKASQNGRIRVLQQAVNSGGVGNWNATMRATRGEYIAWCSDDDRFLPHHLQASLAFLERHPEIGVVHSSFIDSIEADSRIEQTPRPFRSSKPIIVDQRNLTRYMIRYYNWPFHPSTIVMRREVWEFTGEFDPEYALADTDWFVRAASIAKIALLPRHGVINRRHPGNWSNRVGSASMQREIFEIVEKVLALRPWFSRMWWRAIWRTNVRARLLLTLRSRIKSGHGKAACAAWHALVQHTGRRAPQWFEDLGTRWIRSRIATGAEAGIQTVSPL